MVAKLLCLVHKITWIVLLFVENQSYILFVLSAMWRLTAVKTAEHVQQASRGSCLIPGNNRSDLNCYHLLVKHGRLPVTEVKGQEPEDSVIVPALTAPHTWLVALTSGQVRAETMMTCEEKRLVPFSSSDLHCTATWSSRLSSRLSLTAKCHQPRPVWWCGSGSAQRSETCSSFSFTLNNLLAAKHSNV